MRFRLPAGGRLGEVLGINRRNLEYVYRGNARLLFPRVDDKIRAKEMLAAAGLPVPRSLAQLRRRDEIGPCVAALRSETRFVVKPARSSGGAGVKFVDRSTGQGTDPDWEQLAFHMTSILSGMYALDSLTDRVLVEEFVEEASQIRAIHAGAGVADLRVLVCDSRPVMAMLRLPCRASGTANLHSGGIGVGIDLESGCTTHGIRRGRPVSTHPDTGLPLAGVRVPGWERVLETVGPVNDIFGLGYLGVDVIVAQGRGPVILEVNARPGLAIQLANRRGLRGLLSGRGTGVGLP